MSPLPPSPSLPLLSPAHHDEHRGTGESAEGGEVSQRLDDGGGGGEGTCSSSRKGGEASSEGGTLPHGGGGSGHGNQLYPRTLPSLRNTDPRSEMLQGDVTSLTIYSSCLAPHPLLTQEHRAKQ